MKDEGVSWLWGVGFIESEYTHAGRVWLVNYKHGAEHDPEHGRWIYHVFLSDPGRVHWLSCVFSWLSIR